MKQYQQLIHLIKLCSHIYIFAAYSGITSHNLLILCTKYFDCNFIHIVNPVKLSQQRKVVLHNTKASTEIQKGQSSNDIYSFVIKLNIYIEHDMVENVEVV